MEVIPVVCEVPATRRDHRAQGRMMFRFAQSAVYAAILAVGLVLPSHGEDANSAL